MSQMATRNRPQNPAAQASRKRSFVGPAARPPAPSSPASSVLPGKCTPTASGTTGYFRRARTGSVESCARGGPRLPASCGWRWTPGRARLGLRGRDRRESGRTRKTGRTLEEVGGRLCREGRLSGLRRLPRRLNRGRRELIDTHSERRLTGQRARRGPQRGERAGQRPGVLGHGDHGREEDLAAQDKKNGDSQETACRQPSCDRKEFHAGVSCLTPKSRSYPLTSTAPTRCGDQNRELITIS